MMLQYKKILAVALLAGVLAATLIVPLAAQAQQAAPPSLSLWSALSGGFEGFLHWGYSAVLYLASNMLAATISIVAYFIEIFLDLTIVNSVMVKTGYAVTLSIANLAFVLAIIMMAIATMIGNESYGLKATLRNLIIAAVLVNFSLVIAGAILNFVDTLSNYFLDAISTSGAAGFSTALAGAFNPQQVMLLGQNASNAAAQVGTAAGGGLSFFLNIVFVAGLLLIITLTMGAVAIVLVVRYVYISILLIVMPLIWAAWVLPGTGKYWSTWWQHFLKQAMYAPIMLFFLYLAILTAGAMNTPSGAAGGGGSPTVMNAPSPGGGQLAQVAPGTTVTVNPQAELENLLQQRLGPNGEVKVSAGSASGAFASFFGAFGNQLVGTVLKGVIVVGLALGGIFVAQAGGTAGASAIMGATKGVGKAVGGAAARKSAGLAASAPRRAAESLQRTAPKQYDAGLKRMLNPLNRFMHRAGTPLRTVAQQTETGKAMVKKMEGVEGKGLRGFADRAAASPGLLRSAWTGAKKGSGLFRGQLIGKTKTGEEIYGEVGAKAKVATAGETAPAAAPASQTVSQVVTQSATPTTQRTYAPEGSAAIPIATTEQGGPSMAERMKQQQGVGERENATTPATPSKPSTLRAALKEDAKKYLGVDRFMAPQSVPPPSGEDAIEQLRKSLRDKKPSLPTRLKQDVKNLKSDVAGDVRKIFANRPLPEEAAGTSSAAPTNIPRNPSDQPNLENVGKSGIKLEMENPELSADLNRKRQTPPPGASQQQAA